MYRMSSIRKLDAAVKTFETAKGPWDVPQYFRLENGTDDFTLAVEVEKAGLAWYVHGGIICDQIEPTGLRFEIRKARQRIGGKNENPNVTRKDSGAAGIRAGNGHQSADSSVRRYRGGRPRAGAATSR
jgi:hypothetical protein